MTCEVYKIVRDIQYFPPKIRGTRGNRFKVKGKILQRTPGKVSPEGGGYIE